ncbi:sortase family protein [Amygdalobacter nucleatus]|uniref:Sortase family protein n=2 Tax=Amygdalobacter nucleatus TaxID=3029274 RepID=A0A133YEE0_9FIRM|nr:sortase family protein [Amygdalobacter nucleatus]
MNENKSSRRNQMKKRSPMGLPQNQNPMQPYPAGHADNYVDFTNDVRSTQADNTVLQRDNQLANQPNQATQAWLAANQDSKASQARHMTRNRQFRSRTSKRKRRPLTIALNVVIVLLVFIGVYLVARPLIHQWNRDRSTQALLAGLEKKQQLTNSTEEISETLWVDPNANPINGEEYDLPPGVSADDLVVNEKKNDKGQVLVEAIGRIVIDSVNINLPIVKGATETPLKYGAGWYDYSSKIGEQGGNAVILAHRMLTYGRMFNRLDEVKNGDIVEINYDNKIYKYKVYDSFSVDPKQQDMYECFKPLDNGKTVITLVTCSKDDGRLRIMVRAELIS